MSLNYFINSQNFCFNKKILNLKMKKIFSFKFHKLESKLVINLFSNSNREFASSFFILWVRLIMNFNLERE